jgi:hypothetical protein
MIKDKAIKFLGAFFVAVGSFKLLSNVQGIWWFLANLFRPSAYPTFHDYLFYSSASLFFFIIFPLGILMSGIGIFKIRKWGWQLAVLVCTITFIISFIGIINFAYAVYKTHNIPMPPIPKGAHVGIVSMWPTYISAVISPLLIWLLTRKSIKTAFHNLPEKV